MEKYIVFSNNCCESIISLIKNLTPLHLKVSLIYLEINILIMIFSRSGYKRTRNTLDQTKGLSIKRTVSEYDRIINTRKW